MLQRCTTTRPARFYRLLLMLPLVLISIVLNSPSAVAKTVTYDNPLQVQIPGDGMVESCADPSILRGHTPGDNNWYMYCTTDPLNDEDRNAAGSFNFHLVPMLIVRGSGELDLCRRRIRLHRRQRWPARVGGAERRHLGAGGRLFQRPVLPVLRGHRCQETR